MSEKQLIYQLKKGSQKAFDRIYQIYAARLYLYCLQYIKSQEDSEEIVQDVFVKLWLNRETIVQEESIRSLLFKIAKNQLIDKYRARVNSFEFEEYVNHCNTLSVSVNDTHHLVEFDDFRESLDKAMMSLSETQRKVFEYSKLNHFSNKEIADKLSLKEQTVKNHLSSGLKILREELRKLLIWLLILFNL